MIILSEVEYSYPQDKNVSVKALTEITFKIKKGQQIGLLGPNGSGKSTLLNVINGILKPSKGQVNIFGLDPFNPMQKWEAKKKVPILFQNPENNLIAATVKDDIAFGLENMGINTQEIRKRVEKIIHELDIKKISNREPHQLSAGQKQLVALSGLLALEPEFLLLDEPGSLLDFKGWTMLKSAIDKLRIDKGLGIIWATNNLEEVIEADLWILLSKGRIIKKDKPEYFIRNFELLEEYNLYLTPDLKIAREMIINGKKLDLKKYWQDEWVDKLCS